MNVYDFTVTLTANDKNYLVQAECPPLVGQADPQMIKRADLANLSLLGESLSRGEINDINNAGRIGFRLYQTIFQNGLREFFQRALSVAQHESAGLHILLKFQNTPELHEIPWELLHDGRQFLATNPATPIVRYLEYVNKVESLEIKPPLRILFTTACPEELERLDLATEERHIRTALGELGEMVELVVERRISSGQLRYELMHAQNRGRPFHIWHHCGHGDLLTQDGTTIFALALEDGNATEWVDVAKIRTLIQACPSLRMCTLNVCHGGSSIGLGPALALLNVPAVIGFRREVPDQSALTFVEAFYEAILHKPVDVALGQARMALTVKDSQSLDWALPLLFLRTTNPIFITKPDETHDIFSTQTQETSKGGPTIKIKGKNWKVEKAKIIGVMTVGNQAPPVQSNLQFEFDPETFESKDLLQIAGLSISSEEASKHFDDLQNLAHSLTKDIFESDKE